MASLGCNYGYGDWGNAAKVLHMRQQDYEGKKYAKKLWLKILKDIGNGKICVLN